MNQAMMQPVHICKAECLKAGGLGIRFTVLCNNMPCPAFVIRSPGGVRAYLNRCSHIAVELDWNDGEFLDDSGSYIICATHGARYHALTGLCKDGPCNGRHLVKLKVFEKNDEVWWIPDEYNQPPFSFIQQESKI